MQDYVGKETVIRAEGKDYKLSRLTRSIMKEFAEWSKTLIPNPLDLVAEKLPLFKDFPHLQEIMVKDALTSAKSYGDISSPEVQAVMNSVDGQIRLVTMLLRANHQDITEDEAFDIAMKFAEEKGDSFRVQDDSKVPGTLSD